MVLHVDPVPDVLPVSVKGDRPAFKRGEDDRRDELFRELPGAVVVRAVGGHHRKAVGVVIGPDKVVGGRLRGGIGRVGGIGRGLAKGRVRGGEGAVDLVGGDMEKAEIPRTPFPLPVAKRRVEKDEGPKDIRRHELPGAFDGAIHMALGREVKDPRGTVAQEELGHRLGIPDVPPDKEMVRVMGESVEVGEVPRIGQKVECHHLRLLLPADPVDEVCADEARTPRHDPCGDLSLSIFGGWHDPPCGSSEGDIDRLSS